MVIIGGVVKSDLIFRQSPRCLTPPVALRPVRVSCHNNMFSSRVVTRGLASTVSPKLMSLIHNNNNNNNNCYYYYNRNNYARPSLFDCSLHHHHHHHEESEQLSVNLKLPVINSFSCWKKKLLNICVTLLLGVVLGFVNMPRMCYAVPLGSGESSSSSSITYHSCNSNCPNTKLLQEKVDSFTKLVEEQKMQRYRYYDCDCDRDHDHDRITGDAMAVVFILYFIIKYYKYTLLYPSIVIIPMLIVLRLWRLWHDFKLSKARRVLVFQVGFLDKEKKLQTELNRIIAQTADTSNSEGFNFLFKEVVKVLFQHYDACRFGYTSFVRCVSDTEKNYGDDLAKTIKKIGSDDKCGKQLLKQIHTRELMRHGRDRGTTEIELDNWQFEKLAVGNKEHSMLDNDDYTVVTLLVLARGWIEIFTDFLCNTKRLECTTKRIKAILQIFDGIQTNQIESVKVWCASHSADVVEEKLDRDDPLLNFMQEHLLGPVEPLTELNAEFTHHMEDSENAEKDISDISFSADAEEVPRRPRKSRSRATRFMEVAEAVLRRAGIPPPQNPYFVAQRGLKRNTLPMPTELVRELELPEVIAICDERGRECRGPVNKWSDGRVWLSKGWKVFCRQNEVEDNDWCIIEIVKPPRGDIFLQARLVRA